MDWKYHVFALDDIAFQSGSPPSAGGYRMNADEPGSPRARPFEAMTSA
jgi:hypothetical protein